MADRLKLGREWRVLRLLRGRVSAGSAGDEVYNLLLVLRRDGLEVKVGQLVLRRGNKMLHLVREILQRGDLTGVDIVLSPVEISGEAARMMEEIVIASLEELLPLKQRLISLEVARDGMRRVSGNICQYPEHIQRTVRKHQLAALIRNSVQKFLGGFSLARTVSLGCVDWRFDPGILGLDRETDYCLDYKVEQYVDVSSHIDLILGELWDVKRVCCGEGYRVVLTLEMRVDTRQQLKLETHATTVPGELGPGYRRECVVQSLQQSTATQFTVDRLESLHSVRGVSLDWEEFQDSRQLEETLEIPNIETDIATVLKGIDESFSDETEEAANGDSDTLSEDIEETSAVIKKLLDTPTKSFSKLVFNLTNKASVPSGSDEIISSQVEVDTNQVELSEEQDENDEYVPNLSPIKFLSNPGIAEAHSHEFLTECTGIRQSTSTPEGDYQAPLRYLTSESVSNPADHEKQTSETTDNLNEEDDTFSEDYRVSSSNNLNHTSHDVVFQDNAGDNSVQFKVPEYSPSKVRAYVESLPSPAQTERLRAESDLVTEKRMLDETFDSEASSRSRASKLSEISNLAARFTNTGMFYGSALGGQQQVCPFPEDWQFQTIPESIENNEEID